MKKIILILLPFLFLSCSKTLSTFNVYNNSDFDVTIVSNSAECFVESNSSQEIKASVYDVFEIKEKNIPAKLSISGYRLTISNDYVKTILNVKNLTSEDITFEIPNNYLITTFTIQKAEEKTFELYNIPEIQCQYKYWSLEKINDQYSLIFY